MPEPPIDGRNSSTRRLTYLLLAANALGLVLVSVWFRCRTLGNVPGVNGDEAWYGVQALQMLLQGQYYAQTPTGNPANPMFLGPVTLLHAVFSPSIVLLRSVAVGGGLAALAINWWFCRWVFDCRTAAISTVMLAVLPINIAYSRFAWDASQSLAATLPVLYLSLAAVRFPERRVRYLTLAVVAQVVAALVHPTNVFAGAAIVAAVSIWLRWGTVKRIWTDRSRAVCAVGIVLVVLTVLWMRTPQAKVLSTRLQRVTGNVAELAHPRAAPHFSILYARLFTGGTAYRYIAGSRSWSEWPQADDGEACRADVVLFWVALATSVWLLRRSWRCDARTEDRVLAAAWALSMAAFLPIAGPRAMVPGWERWAICLIGPTVLVVSRGVALACRTSSNRRRAVLVAASLAGWLVLADFQVHYFDHIRHTGGTSHNTFRTAEVDPKRSALDHILSHATDRPILIQASDPFIYWTLRYASMGEEEVRVVWPTEAERSEQFQLACGQGRVWYVEFAGSRNLDTVRATLSGRTVQQREFADYGGRPALCVLRAQHDGR